MQLYKRIPHYHNACIKSENRTFILLNTQAMKKITLLIVALLSTVAVCVFAQTIKGNYAIKNVQTGLLLRIKDANSKNGTPLVSYTPQNWKCMTWNFKHVEGNTYQLQNLFSAKTFTPAGEKTEAGTALEEQPLSAGNSIQQYEFIAVDNNTYLIKVKGTDLYITATSKEVNSKIILTKKKESQNQRWTIYNQEPTM